MRRRGDREGGIRRDDSSLAPLPSDLRLSRPRAGREKPLRAARGLVEGLVPVAEVCVWLVAVVSAPISARQCCAARETPPSSAAGASPRPRFLYPSRAILPLRNSRKPAPALLHPGGLTAQAWQQASCFFFSLFLVSKRGLTVSIS